MGGGRRWAVSTSLALVASDGSAPQALREAARADQCETLADALATAAEPAVTTALLALEAEVVVGEPEGDAAQPLAELLTMTGAVRADAGRELSAVIVGEEADRGSLGSVYREGVGCGVAVQAAAVDGAIEAVTIALWGAAPHPIRARQVEGTLRGRRVSVSLLEDAVATLRSEVQPRGQDRVVDEAALLEIERVGAEALRAIFRPTIPARGRETT